MAAALRVLVIEDREADFRLIDRHLRQQRLAAECVRVASLEELVDVLVRGGVDIVLSDYVVPGLQLKDSLAQIQALAPGLPIILVSGKIGEEAAVELLKQGVWDVVLKDRLARLVPAILSARQFGQDNLLERVKASLQDSSLPPNCLVLELTESLLVEPTAATMKAKAMRLKTVAEGVEQDSQVHVLRDLGVDALQGHDFGRATPASDVKLMSALDPAA
jgi:DNA-binding NtrC family response regulator